MSNKILERLSALGLTNRGAKIKDSTLAGPSGQYPDGSKADYFTTNVLAKELGLTGIIVEHAFLDHGYDAAKLQDENFLRQLGLQMRQELLRNILGWWKRNMAGKSIY